MIQINSFNPTDNLTRRTWEFHEDKITVKTKSLKADVEHEIKYEKIKFIRTKKSTDLNWIWFSFIILVVLSVAKLGLDYFCIINSTIESAEKAVATFALLIMLFSVRKYEFYYFLDAEKYHLGNVKIDNDKKKVQIAEAINLIKQKTNIISEVYLGDPLPGTNPVFEIIEFDFPDFLNKSTTRFYDDKIIETHKSLVEESVIVTNYNELNGKTKKAKIGNDNWGYVFSYWLVFVCITGLLIPIFFSKQISGNSLFLKLFFVGLTLLIPIYFLRFIKNEFLIFNDKNDDGDLGIGINNKNREKLTQITEFVRSRVESQNQKPA